MKKTLPRKYLVLILLLELIFILHHCNQYILNHEPQLTATFAGKDFSSRAGYITDDSYYVDSNFGYTGTFTYGPYTPVKQGSYLVTLYYSANSDGNYCYAHSNTVSSFGLQSSYRTYLPADRTSISFPMDVTQHLTDLEIITHYGGEGYLRLERVELSRTATTYARNIIHAVLFCLLINLCLFFYIADTHKRKHILALTLIILAASYPLFTDYLVSGHDLMFHLNRIEGICTGLQQGNFPVKIHPLWNNDYGYATGVFYGDIFLYFPALLRLIGFSVQNAYKLYVFGINLATVLIAYKCFGKIFADEKIGLFASLLYSLAPYRLTNLYLRCAVGEYTALTFLPLVFYGFFMIFTQLHTQKNGWKYAIPTALGLSGIIQSHIISCELVALIIVIVCLVMIGKVCIGRVFFTLCLTVGITLCLNLGFLVPFLSYFNGDFVINSPEWYQSPIQSQGVYIAQLFSLFQSGVGTSASTNNGMAGEMPLGIGFPFLAGILLFVYLHTSGAIKQKNTIFYKTALFSFLLAVFCLALSTHLFPWDRLADFSDTSKRMICNIQFPWRFHTLGTLFLVVVCCYAFQIAKEYFTKELYHMLLTGMMCFIIISSSWFYYDSLNRDNIMRPYDSTHLNSTALGSQEYLPADTNVDLLVHTAPIPDEHVVIHDYKKSGTRIHLEVSSFQSGGYIDLPLLYYEGYVAETTDTHLPLTLSKGDNNVIRLALPNGFEGSVSVWFREPPLWRIAEIISALSLLLLIGFSIYSKQKSPT
ncbi:MAG: hypothetical protein IJ335_02075 [Lachnospiraceae bacterium]|nr:hypothetical protein [Lachnospiraceae bacterium]